MGFHRFERDSGGHCRTDRASVSGAKNSGSGNFDCDALCAFLRRRLPAGTANHVAALTGVPASTVDKWLRGETKPSARHFAALVAAFGPELMAAAMPGQRWAARQARHEAIARHIREIIRLSAEARPPGT